MRLRPIPILAGMAVAAAIVAPTAAHAGDNVPPRPQALLSSTNCTTVKHGDLTGVTKTGTPAASLQIDGVEISTPANPDKVVWKTDTAATALKNVKALSYQTYKFATGASSEFAAPAYHIYLSLPGGKSATLVYEPYWQSEGAGLLKPSTTEWQPWNPMSGKWWTSSHDVIGMTAEGGGGEHNALWGDIVTLNPEAAVVGYGWGQGTYNAGAKALVQAVLFKNNSACNLHNWSTNNPAPVATTTTAPAVVPVVQPTGSQSASAAATGSLPVTGSNGVVLGSVAVLFVGVGVGLFMVSRRRRTTFEA